MKIGDLVRIKSFNEIEESRILRFAFEMKEFCGTVTEITDVHPLFATAYKVKGNTWFWDESWLEPENEEYIKHISENDITSLFE